MSGARFDVLVTFLRFAVLVVLLGVLVLALLYALNAPLRAQVIVQYSPEPMAVLGDLAVRGVGVWSVRACNNGMAVAEMPAERFYIAAPAGVRLIEPSRVLPLLSRGQRRSRAAVAAKIVGYGLLLATSVTGFGAVAASKVVVASLGLATGAAGLAQKDLQAEVPNLEPFTSSLLVGEVVLEPRQCMTRTAFAAKMPEPRAAVVEVQP